jgi:hypothetical protein
MRRKRYKKGHVGFLALEASTLTFNNIDERVMFHTNRQRYGKTKPRPCDLAFDHRISSYSRVMEDGLLTASYMLTLDPKEFSRLKITSAQVVKNVRKSMEACTENWSNSVDIRKISVAKNAEGQLYLWIIFDTQLKGWDMRKFGDLYSCVRDTKLHDEAGRILEVYAAVHYVLMMCLFEYPGYLITGKVD